MRVLVTAASVHGVTAGIADAIADALRKRGLEVDAIAPERADGVERYHPVVLGSAVHVGHWLDPARQLVRRYSANAFPATRLAVLQRAGR